MASSFNVGDSVQTLFGKGVVREVRNARLVVDVRGHALVVERSKVSVISGTRKRFRSDSPVDSRPDMSRHEALPRGATKTLDLHGLTVDEALARAEEALNDALLANLPELRLIHGRSGGRIRAALHRRLREIGSVREFKIDPHNEGVTIVGL
jgi:dsDNA-specific endonuclease/ATPase MutS2